jgi:tetrahedral aminopeptidase
MDLLKRLSETPGVSGREEFIRKIIANEMKPFVDEVTVDTLGNLIGVRKGNGKRRVMMAAHMDEIGFMVTSVDENGFLRFAPVGGFDPRALFAQRVLVHGKEPLKGVLALATKPTHLLDPEEAKKPPKISDYYIDLGLPGDKVKELVNIGDPITMLREAMEFGDCITGKAMDDRVGVYVMLKALEQAKNTQVDIYAVATVQEEVGVRGAQVSSFEIDPEIGIALDVTIASDTPGNPENEKVTMLGKGVALKVMDSYSISNPKLVQRMRELADEKGIPYQLEILPRGGTDAAAIQRSRRGTAVITISIPTRQVHTTVETCRKSDIQGAVDLLAAFLEIAHEGDYAPTLEM